MTTLLVFLTFLGALSLTAVVALVIIWRTEKRAHESTRRALQRTTERILHTESGVAELVQAVTPLVEQTDWMTGRWGGQFSTLQSMENARNRHAVAARKVLLSLPLLKEIGASMTWAEKYPLSTDTPLKIDRSLVDGVTPPVVSAGKVQRDLLIPRRREDWRTH